MVLTRIQASDFQAEKTKKENLSRLEAIAQFSAQGKPSAVDIVGDVFDTHILQEISASSPQKNIKALLEAKPELKKTITEYITLIGNLQQTYGKDIDEKSSPEEKSVRQKLEENIARSGYNDAQAQDFIESVRSYYSECAKALAPIKAPIYFIRGNNDTNTMQDILKGRYPELEGKLIEDGKFRIIGLNNTNYPLEDILTNMGMGAAHVPPDFSTAYSKYSAKKTGKKANVIMMHGPPNGFRDGQDGKAGEDITKLLDEHTPDKGFLLVECGHFHKAKLEAVKSKDGKKGYIIARSSPNIFFEHSFDDNGNYLSTHIYKHKN